MSINLDRKIKSLIQKNGLKLKAGERHWWGYFIRITELVWARNLWDGYQIEVYTEKYGKHLSTSIV